ncbi:hypothetical protein [Sulfuriferula nivalis]|uniref:Uncharacterized protein n=1 Tax=Sulfuriferula nivalis TaxID=2675298 RepID=A0A809RJI3_9PROT|nr:hypothetical protein [Sulfuriferula nivalis]BBP01655.1 hypothetical protein SFSGTM_23630 [Sulfuriferula nivalis]
MSNHKKTIAKTNAKSDNTQDSLLKCEVNLETGEWISPEGCKVFYINEDAKFPDITYEIKTDNPGPYEWQWKINWVVQSCLAQTGKKRGKVTHPKTFSEQGKFTSNSKSWKADLGAVIGGDLTVTVKVGTQKFIRKTFIRGKEPGSTKVHAYLDTFPIKEDVELVKKIFNQESHTKHFYSDEMPLTSFDNGYGLGQLTNEPPTYEQIWSWKKHIDEILKKRIPTHRKRAKAYLDVHRNYDQAMLNLETLASYNGLAHQQRYFNWDGKKNQWIENENVICDKTQSNKGWDLEEKTNQDKTLEELKKDGHPFYTGVCYAEHIKNNQGI